MCVRSLELLMQMKRKVGWLQCIAENLVETYLLPDPISWEISYAKAWEALDHHHLLYEKQAGHFEAAG